MAVQLGRCRDTGGGDGLETGRYKSTNGYKSTNKETDEKSSQILYKDLSYQIVGILFDVYNEIGPNHKENIYQRAIEKLLKRSGIPFQSQVKTEISLFGEPIGLYFLDFLIDGKIVLEIKARNQFCKSDYQQVKAYLKTKNCQLGILATFASDGVRSRRILNLPNFKFVDS